jgi:hypothetical protein
MAQSCTKCGMASASIWSASGQCAPCIIAEMAAAVSAPLAPSVLKCSQCSSMQITASYAPGVYTCGNCHYVFSPATTSSTAIPVLSWDDDLIIDDKEAQYWNGKWGCWFTGCSGELKYGEKNCNRCGRQQRYPDLKAKQSKRLCTKCSVELSSYLDAYHGTDANKAAQCSKCRR